MSRTSVTFLLDRTGSMMSCKEATIEAFNAYLDGLKTGDEAKNIEFSFLQFDSISIDKVCVNADVLGVAPLTNQTYEPRASTPLVDAAYKTIKAIEESLTKRIDSPKVVVCIQTDGFENASTQYTMKDLNALIKEKSGLGWQFVFMGAGIDAYAQGVQMGVAVGSTISYDKSSRVKTSATFSGLASNTRAFAGGEAATMDFSSLQKANAGDAFIDKHGQLNSGSPVSGTVTGRASVAKPNQANAPKPDKPIVDDITL